LLKTASSKITAKFREESAALKTTMNDPSKASTFTFSPQIPPIVFQMIEMCLDLNSSSRPGAKLLTMYLRENTAEIITFKSEELNKEIEDIKKVDSALRNPRISKTATEENPSSPQPAVDHTNNNISALKSKRQLILDNIRKERIILSGLCFLFLVIISILIFLIVRLCTG
jgi:hypothetical protein